MPEHLTRPEIKAFIRKHENEDVAVLMLKRSRYPDLPMEEIAAQILSRQKAKDKLPEWYEHEDVIFPVHTRLQQSSSQATAQYKASRFTGSTYLDLTGGTGIDAYYFMQGFTQGVILEPDPELFALLQHNFNVLGIADRVEILNTTAEDFLQQTEQSFDLIFADPSRRSSKKGKVSGLRDSSPDITEFMETLSERSGGILIKASPMTDHRKAAEEIGGVTSITLLSVDNEVKEVLLLSEGAPSEDPLIEVCDLSQSSPLTFRFKESEERIADASYSMPKRFLFDPIRGLRKAGCFNLIADRYGLKKLNTNTQLYTSDELRADFPGRKFKVKGTTKVSRKELQKLLSSKKVNLALRNYPGPVSVLRKKLGTTDGGRQFAFAAETLEGYKLIVCEKC